MPQITRREAITAALAAAIAADDSPIARADKTDDRLAKLIQAMEDFRTMLPAPRGLGEVNGFTIKELGPYTTSHLSGVANRLGATSRADCLILLTYLKDADPKLRFIAFNAIYQVVDGYRNGIASDMDNILDTRTDGHLQQVRRFVELIDKLNA
jgi:hypothetical protein